MRKLKSQNGITLIALIITIIIMLILVTVTINVALNGGLFQKASLAGTETQKQADKEELMMAAFGTIDNQGNLQINKTDLEKVLSDGWSIDNTNSITDNNNETWYPCTSPRGIVYYLNTTTGAISESEPTQQEGFLWASVGLGGIDTSAEYQFAGYTITFSNDGIYTITGPTDEQEIVDAKVDTSTHVTNDGKFTYNSDYFGTVIISIRPDENLDCDISGNELYHIPEGTYIYEKNAVVGKYVYYNYDGNHPNSIWRVVGKDNDEKLKILSTEAIGNITLPETSTIAEAVDEWNDIPNKIDVVLGEITETTFRYGNPEFNTVLESGTKTITIDSNQYIVNVYKTSSQENIRDNFLYDQRSDVMKSGKFLRIIMAYDDELWIQDWDAELGYGSGIHYVSANGNISELSGYGIGIVVTLKSGVTLNKSSGAGTFESPYTLTSGT